MTERTCKRCDRPFMGRPRTYVCSDCKARAKRRATESFLRRNPGYLAEHHRGYKARVRPHLRRYGLTAETYDAIAEAQSNRCAICDRTTQLVVDHDHARGPTAVRGLLCSDCNRGLGCFADDPARLLNAARYLAYAALVNPA